MFQIYKDFYKIIFQFKLPLFAGFTLLIISSILANSIPVILKILIDSAQTGDIDMVYNIFIVLIFVKLGNVLFYTFAIQCSDVVIGLGGRDLRLKVFRHLHNLDFAYHTNKSSGSLISLFKRGEGAFMGLHDQLNLWGLSIILDFVFMILVFSQVYPKLIIIALVSFALNIIIMFFTLKKNLRCRKNLNFQDDCITGVTVDNMTAFDTVKYFANEEYEQKRLSDLTKIWRKFLMYYVESFRIIDIANGGVIAISMLFVIGVALMDYVNGQISVGNFVMATSFATIFFPSLVRFVFNIRDIAKNYEDLKRYIQILREPINVKDNPIVSDQKEWSTLKNFTISFNDVDFSYGNSRDVLKDITIDIKSGESIALVGKSGAGKTTFTKLLMRFYDPQKGNISVGGVNIRNITKQELRQKIGIVPQETVLFNDTIAYNIAYGRESFTMKEIHDACKAANLLTFIESLPDGFMTVVGERGVKLSGGQKQRLAIARVFLEDAPIILFDEATSSLDSESEKLIQEAFWNVSKNKTTIIIAHRLSTVKKVDRIIVFDDGKIIEQGSHAQLTRKSSGIYKHLWDLQTEGDVN